MKSIPTSCSHRVMERTVMPAIRRAGMRGLALAKDANRIQAMVDAALQRDPEYVRSLVQFAARRWA